MVSELALTLSPDFFSYASIFFSSQNTPSLHAFTDADWTENIDVYTSTGIYIIYFGKHPIAWPSKKETGIARSST